jgi:hypothetical protein
MQRRAHDRQRSLYHCGLFLPVGLDERYRQQYVEDPYHFCFCGALTRVVVPFTHSLPCGIFLSSRSDVGNDQRYHNFFCAYLCNLHHG